MKSRSQLSPPALAVGFGVATFVAMILFFAPMHFSMFGMHGNGMMGAWYYGMGFGAGFFVLIWGTIVGAIGGAIVAVVYNAFLRTETTVAGAESPRTL